MFKKTNDFPLITAAAIAVVVFFLMLGWSCNSCNKKDPVVVPVADQIIKDAQPAIDSLKRANANLQKENDSLSAVNKILQEKKIEQRYRIKESKVSVVAAEEKNDTAALVIALKKTVMEQEEYIKTADHDATVQGQTIENLIEQNKNSYAEAELQKSIVKKVANYANGLELIAANNEKERAKEERRKKGWRKVAIVAGVVAIAEGFLLSL